MSRKSRFGAKMADFGGFFGPKSTSRARYGVKLGLDFAEHLCRCCEGDDMAPWTIFHDKITLGCPENHDLGPKWPFMAVFFT